MTAIKSGGFVPVRLDEIDEINALMRLARRISTLEDACKRRLLPPGYEFETDAAGNIVVNRVSDDAQGTVVLS